MPFRPKKPKPKRIQKESFRTNPDGLVGTRWTKLTGPSTSVVIDVTRVYDRTVTFRVSEVNLSRPRTSTGTIADDDIEIGLYSFLSAHSVYQYIGTVKELDWIKVGAFVIEERGGGRNFSVVERLGAGRVYFSQPNEDEQRNLPYAEFAKQFREMNDDDAIVPLPAPVRFEKIPRTITAYYVTRPGWYDFPWGRRRIDDHNMYYFDGALLGGTVDGASNADDDDHDTDIPGYVTPRPMKMTPEEFMRVYQPVVEKAPVVEESEPEAPAVSRFERVS